MLSDFGSMQFGLAPDGKIRDVLRSDFSTFWLAAASLEFVPFGGNLTHFRPKSDTSVKLGDKTCVGRMQGW